MSFEDDIVIYETDNSLLFNFGELFNDEAVAIHCVVCVQLDQLFSDGVGTGKRIVLFLDHVIDCFTLVK